MELTGDSTAHTYYGGPEKVWIQVQVGWVDVTDSLLPDNKGPGV